MNKFWNHVDTVVKATVAILLILTWLIFFAI